ncbi:hypothetical protein FG379_001253 [Cryptosporidium bovis]|uniref:uncharacterized protein n=1 Tax=Cryptosporidium bovis TaxID=310047 RepID=UPI00351A107E|nr:hypothetical protein FG379_001253 [Cryptosporidium bovis]
MDDGIRFKNEIVEDLKSNNIPLNIILGATNGSPPGINMKRSVDSDKNSECDDNVYINMKKDVINRHSNTLVLKNSRGNNCYNKDSDHYFVGNSNSDKTDSNVRNLGYDKKITSSDLEILDTLGSNKNKVIPKFRLPIYNIDKRVNVSNHDEINNKGKILDKSEYTDFKYVDTNNKKISYSNCSSVVSDNGNKLTERVKVESSRISECENNFYCLNKNDKDKTLIEEINKENTELAINIIKEISTGSGKLESENSEFKVIGDNFENNLLSNSSNKNIEKISFDYSINIKNNDDIISEYDDDSTRILNDNKYISDSKIEKTRFNMYCKKVDNGEMNKNKVSINNMDMYIPVSSSSYKVIPMGENENKSIQIEEIIEAPCTSSKTNSYTGVNLGINNYNNCNNKNNIIDGFKTNINIDEGNNINNKIYTSKIYIDRKKNSDKYNIFKSEEEFSELFNKLWIEAGEEIKEKEGNHINNELLNPVPFRSDLLEVNNKRKIKTTIPPIKELGGNSNNKINPFGLLRLLKDTSSVNIKDDDYKYKTKIYDNAELVNSNYTEELSTRASSTFLLNNNESVTHESNKVLSLLPSNTSSNKLLDTKVDYPTFIFTKRKNNTTENNNNLGIGVGESGNRNNDVTLDKEILSQNLNNRINDFENFLVIKNEYYTNSSNNLNEYELELKDNSISNIEKENGSYQISVLELGETLTESRETKIDDFKIELDLDKYDYGFSIDSIQRDNNDENLYNEDKNDGKDDNNGRSSSLTNTSSLLKQDDDYSPELKEDIEDNLISTKIMNSLILTEKYRNLFAASGIKELFLSSQDELDCNTNITQNYKCDWSESIRYYRDKILPMTKNKNIKLLLISTLIMLSFVSFNVILPLLVLKVVNYKNSNTERTSYMVLVLTNPILNYISLYLVNCIIFNIVIGRIISFSQLLFKDYVNYINNIRGMNKVSGENTKSVDSNEDVMVNVFNNVVNIYIEGIVSEKNTIVSRLSKIIYLSEFIGVIQVTVITTIALILSFGIFNVNANNAVKILLLSVSQNLVYWLILAVYLIYKAKKKMQLIQSSLLNNKNSSVGLNLLENCILNYIQTKQIQFLTFTSYITELVLLNNYLLNNGNMDTNLFNISLYEMEQHIKKYRKKTKETLKNTKILSRIHFKENHSGICPYAYIHYNSNEKSIYISNYSLSSKDSKNYTCLNTHKIPTKVISIEYIQYTETPWLYIYNKDSIFSQDNEYGDNIIDYFFDKQFIFKENENSKREKLIWNIHHLIDDFNYIKFDECNKNGKLFDDCNYETQYVYLLNCNFPGEFISAREKNDKLGSGELVKFQILCFSFNDLMNIYRVLS